MSEMSPIPGLDTEKLREAIRCEYREVARAPEQGFHFHTGRRLAALLRYDEALLAGVPERAIESFAGTGNPFRMGRLAAGERVVDLGCGAGFDSLIAARQVGPDGRVVGVDMTEEMLDRARAALEDAGGGPVEFRRGYLEEVPVQDGWADVVISNGAINLCPDKRRVFDEIHRVLRPGGRIQMGDILVERSVSDESKRKIDLWTG